MIDPSDITKFHMVYFDIDETMAIYILKQGNKIVATKLNDALFGNDKTQPISPSIGRHFS